MNGFFCAAAVGACTARWPKMNDRAGQPTALANMQADDLPRHGWLLATSRRRITTSVPVVKLLLLLAAALALGAPRAHQARETGDNANPSGLDQMIFDPEAVWFLRGEPTQLNSAWTLQPPRRKIQNTVPNVYLCALSSWVSVGTRSENSRLRDAMLQAVTPPRQLAAKGFEALNPVHALRRSEVARTPLSEQGCKAS